MNVAYLYTAKLWLLVVGVPLISVSLTFLSLGVGAYFNFREKKTGVLKTGLLTGGAILIVWLIAFIRGG